MGEVYLGEDSRLGRQVALKILPASFQYDPVRRERFLREARAASALRSPNTAAIYDIGEHEGTIFIAMEYVEGDTLSQRIHREPFPAREAADIAYQIADALDEAHGLGIIHRDIKSSNIIVTARGLVPHRSETIRVELNHLPGVHRIARADHMVGQIQCGNHAGTRFKESWRVVK